MAEMDDPKLKELRKLVGQREKLIFEAVKAGLLPNLQHEEQLYARAIQEHMDLKHIHNALEFADLREGEQYEITAEGVTVNPLAHLAVHAAVKGQIAEDPSVREAFDKMVATGTSAHHAEHVLGALLMEAQWEAGHADETGKDPARALTVYNGKIKKLVWDSVYRKKLTREFTDDHSAFE
jgi:Domain of unknown function (DUF1841)